MNLADGDLKSLLASKSNDGLLSSLNVGSKVDLPNLVKDVICFRCDIMFDSTYHVGL